VIWLSWRQQRTETLLTAALLALLAALSVPATLHLASLYTHDGIASCISRQTTACQEAIASFSAHQGLLGTLVNGWINLLLGLLGVALAAPLVLDLEHGTATFAWTQGVTRARWLATRLAVAVVTALAAGGAYALLLGWYRGPLDKVFGHFDGFDVEGIVPLSYVLFALGLGLAVGAVWRRTAPAMFVAFLAYFGARISTDTWLRKHFATPLIATWGPGTPSPNLRRAWVLWEGPSNRAGHPFAGSFHALDRCSRAVGGTKTLDQHCLARIGAGFNHAVYQPASRFWEFQGIEAALFGGLALLLVAFAAWRVLASD
jgi:hypothetical protein